MKKITFLFISLTAILFTACGEFKYSNEKQIEYDAELKRLNSLYSEPNNDIKKQEIENEYEKFVSSFFTTNVNIDNWNGRIEDISLKGTDSTKSLTFSIYCTTTDYTGSTTFLCSYLISGEKIESDPILNTVRNLNERDAVIFSGEILKNSSGVPMFEPAPIFHPTLHMYIDSIKAE